mgnify:FL=1
MRYLQGLLDERQRIAEELHDNLSAKLSAMKIQVSGKITSEDEFRLKTMRDLDDLRQDVQNISHAISPILLKSKGLKKTLDEFILKIEDSAMDMVFDYELAVDDEHISSPHLEILYFTILELINNALKHAQTSFLKLEVKEDGDFYTLVVEDRGIGFDIDKVQGGLGLSSIRQRADFLNGSFHIEALEKGTKSTFTIRKT